MLRRLVGSISLRDIEIITNERMTTQPIISWKILPVKEGAGVNTSDASLVSTYLTSRGDVGSIDSSSCDNGASTSSSCSLLIVLMIISASVNHTDVVDFRKLLLYALNRHN